MTDTVPIIRSPKLKLTDQEIEAIAVKHEEYGFGRADAEGLTTHGFDPEGLLNFIHEVIEKNQ